MNTLEEIKALHTSGIYAKSGNETIKESIIKIILLPITIIVKIILLAFKTVTFYFGNYSANKDYVPHHHGGVRRKALSNDERLRIFSGRLGYNKNDPTVPNELRDKLKY